MIRPATSEDLPLVESLWRAFGLEVPDAAWRPDDSEDELAALRRAIGEDVVLLADDQGLAVATLRGPRLGFLDVLYVRPESRASGLAAALVLQTAAELRARGADTLELEVLASNAVARRIYERWGFAPVELTLATPIDSLVTRLAAPAGPTFGAVYVQTDDTAAVDHAVQRALPRFGHSEAATVEEPVNGWVAVRADLIDREPDVLRRLGKELSYTTGGVVVALGVEDGALVRYVLYDRGSSVDEYHGPLPPGDVIALGANPTVVARLTGADPARVREVARIATTPAELPPAVELHAQIADVLGVPA